jgi:TPR repeat protein
MKRSCRPWAALLLFAACTPAIGAQATPDKGVSGNAAPHSEQQQFSDRVAGEKSASDDAKKASKGDGAALDRLMKGADQGDASAQFYLALLYKDGLGVPKDDVRFASWLRKAGEQDHAGAQARLIGVYEEGRGVAKDPVQAAQWARRAADQGELAGQLALVMDYYYGRGVARSYVEAIKWQAILEAKGFVSRDEDFTRELEHAAGAIQTEEGRALAREWFKTPHDRR